MFNLKEVTKLTPDQLRILYFYCCHDRPAHKVLCSILPEYNPQEIEQAVKLFHRNIRLKLEMESNKKKARILLARFFNNFWD